MTHHGFPCVALPYSIAALLLLGTCFLVLGCLLQRRICRVLVTVSCTPRLTARVLRLNVVSDCNEKCCAGYDNVSAMMHGAKPLDLPRMGLIGGAIGPYANSSKLPLSRR